MSQPKRNESPMKHIVVNVSEQSLSLFEKNQLVKTYNVSTALNGTGSESGSGKTPLGKHCIRAKIGQDLPLNSVLVGRRPTGEIYSKQLAESAPNRDWILTRIMWLSGLEKGQNRLGNVDTMQRYIYIHGTPESEPMGIALSHGCIRMRNDDVVELFELVPVGTSVEILP